MTISKTFLFLVVSVFLCLLSISTQLYSADVQMDIGEVSVSSNIDDDGNLQISIGLTAQKEPTVLFIAPFLTNDTMNSLKGRYIFKDDVKKTQVMNCEFIINNFNNSHINFAILMMFDNKTCSRQLFNASINEKGNVVAIQARSWADKLSSFQDDKYSVTILPNTSYWLLQGYCLIRNVHDDENNNKLLWKLANKTDVNNEQYISEMSKASLWDIATIKSNQAIVAALEQDYTNSNKAFYEAQLISELVDLRLDLRAVIWLNHGITAWQIGEKSDAVGYWRRVMRFPKEHIGIGGTLCTLLRRRVEALVTEVLPDIRHLSICDIELDDTINQTLGINVIEVIGEAQTLMIKGNVINNMKGQVVSSDIYADRLVLLCIEEQKKKCKLITISLENGSLVDCHELDVGSNKMHIELTAEEKISWLIDYTSGKLLKINGGIVEKEYNIGKNGMEIVGHYFDEREWYFLYSANSKIILHHLNEESGENKREFTDDFGNQVVKVHGLCFAGPGLADIVVEENIELNEINKKLKEFKPILSNIIKLNSGGAAELPYLQILEAARGKSVRYYAIYRRWQPQKGKVELTKRILKDSSGKGIGCHGEHTIQMIKGTNKGDAWILMKQVVPVSREKCYSLILKECRNAIRAVCPLRMSRECKGVVISCDDKRLVAYIMGNKKVIISNYPNSHWRYPVIVNDPIQIQPTKERPVVQDMTGKDRVLFGGREGSLPRKIKWPKEISKVVIGPSGINAAALCAQRTLKKPYILFYNSEGDVILKVDLPDLEAYARRQTWLWIDDQERGVVYILDRSRGVGNKVRHTVYLINQEHVKLLSDMKMIKSVRFFKGGFASLSKHELGNMKLYYHDYSGNKMWEKTIRVVRGPSPIFLLSSERIIIHVDGKNVFYDFDGNLTE